MSCLNPRPAIIPQHGSPIFLTSDEDKQKFLHKYWGFSRVVYLPCGGCLNCRRERRQELTLLQCCEASLYEDNWFLTLTYEDERTFDETGIFPYSLDKSHLSDFCESMRKHCSYNNTPFRFFACGEYGDRFERPHYHLSLFGLPPEILGIKDDEETTRVRRDTLERYGRASRVSSSKVDNNGNFYWQSPVVSARWKFGDHKIYRANKETFQYVAGYVTKKLTGKAGRDWKATGRVLPFLAQSRPSIGRPWFDKFFQTLSLPDGEKLVNDCLAIADVEWKCPRIFSRWLESIDPFEAKEINEKVKRLRIKEYGEELRPDRIDLKRKSDFERYRAARYKQENTHKEVN